MGVVGDPRIYLYALVMLLFDADLGTYRIWFDVMFGG
jgi:hypothetical protein